MSALSRADLHPGLVVEVRSSGDIEAWPTVVVDPLHPDGILVGQLVGHDAEHWWLRVVPAVEAEGTGTAEAQVWAEERRRRLERTAGAAR